MNEAARSSSSIGSTSSIGASRSDASRRRPSGTTARRSTCDTTGRGEPVYESLCKENIRVEPYTFTNKSKAALIDNLAMMFEKREIVIPRPELWPVGIDELEAFEYSVTDQGTVRTGAPGGMHDDCVIALALAAVLGEDVLEAVQAGATRRTGEVRRPSDGLGRLLVRRSIVRRRYANEGESIRLHPAVQFRAQILAQFCARMDHVLIPVTGLHVLRECWLHVSTRARWCAANGDDTMNAAASYSARLTEVRDLIRRLEGSIAIHVRRQNARPGDWGFVGDLSHIADHLREITPNHQDRRCEVKTPDDLRRVRGLLHA